MTECLIYTDSGDSIALRASDEPGSSSRDSLSLMIENADTEMYSDFDLKLMEIETEQMEIPDVEHQARRALPLVLHSSRQGAMNPTTLM